MTTHAPATPVTAEEFDALGDIGRAELVRGKVVYLSKPKPRHGRIAMKIGRAVAGFVEARGLGEVYAAETGFLIERGPDTLRAPDVSFVRAERVAAHDPDEWYPHSPDLAVEVLSPGDRPGVVLETVRMWLGAGGKSVWVIDPARRTAAVHRADGTTETVAEDGNLHDEAVLPGFAVPLRDVLD